MYSIYVNCTLSPNNGVKLLKEAEKVRRLMKKGKRTRRRRGGYGEEAETCDKGKESDYIIDEQKIKRQRDSEKT